MLSAYVKYKYIIAEVYVLFPVFGFNTVNLNPATFLSANNNHKAKAVFSTVQYKHLMK